MNFGKPILWILKYAALRVLPVDQLAQSGVQTIGFVHTSRRFFFIFWNFDSGEFREKGEKDVFWKREKRQTWLFLFHAHRSPWRFPTWKKSFLLIL